MAIIEQKARDISRPVLEAIGRTLAGWGVSPNVLTYIGLLLTSGVAALAALGELRWAGVTYIFAALFDALDGTVARVSGKGSRFGAFLDSSIDRLDEAVVFLGLIIHYTLVGAVYEVPLILVVTVFSLMISYTRARAEGLGVNCKAGFMSRPLRVVVLILGLILNQVLIALAVLAVTTAITVIQRIVHVRRMTGGEKGGWGSVQEPFYPPVPPVPDPDGGDAP